MIGMTCRLLFELLYTPLRASSIFQILIYDVLMISNFYERADVL